MTDLTLALEGPHWSLHVSCGQEGEETDDREASRGAASPVPGLARLILAELASVRVREGGRTRCSRSGFHRHPHGCHIGISNLPRSKPKSRLFPANLLLLQFCPSQLMASPTFQLLRTQTPKSFFSLSLLSHLRSISISCYFHLRSIQN